MHPSGAQPPPTTDYHNSSQWLGDNRSNLAKVKIEIRCDAAYIYEYLPRSSAKWGLKLEPGAGNYRHASFVFFHDRFSSSESICLRERMSR
jgi:hypothetical protein